VSRRKAVKVISFSGSYLALKQTSDLFLHALRLAEQTLFDGQSLEPSFSASDVVDFCCAVLNCTPEEVF
jgi:hypothetical protein